MENVLGHTHTHTEENFKKPNLAREWEANQAGWAKLHMMWESGTSNGQVAGVCPLLGHGEIDLWIISL